MQQNVKHQESKQQFILQSDGFESVLQYRMAEDTIMDIFSTQVPEQGRGQGLAGKLAKAALDHAQEKNLKVIATCSYIAAYIARKSDYQKLLVDLGS